MQYHVLFGQQTHGPFTAEQLRAHVPPEGALVWREGLSGWTPLQQIPEFQMVQASRPANHPPLPPPLPPIPQTQPGPGQTPVPATQRSWPEIRLIANRQRRLILGIGISAVAYVLGLPLISVFFQVIGNAAQMPAEAVAILDGLAEWTLILTLCGIQASLAFGVA